MDHFHQSLALRTGLLKLSLQLSAGPRLVEALAPQLEHPSMK